MRTTLFVVFLVCVVLLVTRPQEFVASFQQIPIVQYALLSAFALWLTTPDKGLKHPQFAILPPLLLVAWIGMGLSGWWGGIVKILDQLLPPIFLFVTASGAVRSVPQLRVFMLLLIACASALVLHGHWQLQDGIGWTGAVPIEGRITYSGIFNDPNDIGLLFVVCIGSTLYLLGSASTKFRKLALLAALGWLLYGVYLTDSRGTMLATMTVLGYSVWRRYGWTVLSVAAGIAVPLLVISTRLAQIDVEEASAEGRLDAWYAGLQMWLQHPLFGVGFSNFNDHHYLTAHNSLVLAMAELGIAGYTLWLAFVGYSGLMLYRLAFATELPEQEVSASRALYASCLGFAVGAFFLSQSYKYLLFLLCGLAVGRYMGASAAIGGLPPFRIDAGLVKWPAWAMASIILLWLSLKVLL